MMQPEGVKVLRKNTPSPRRDRAGKSRDHSFRPIRITQRAARIERELALAEFDEYGEYEDDWLEIAN